MRQNLDDDSDPFDRNGVLRDGARFTVKMLARDSAITNETRQRSFADDIADAERRREQGRRAWIDSLNAPSQRDAATAAPPHVPAPRPNAGNRPAAGQPMRSFADAQAIRDRAYEEYCAALVGGTR